MNDNNPLMYECQICGKLRAKDSEKCPHCGTNEVHKSVWLSRLPTAIIIIASVVFLFYSGVADLILTRIFEFLYPSSFWSKLIFW